MRSPPNPHMVGMIQNRVTLKVRADVNALGRLGLVLLPAHAALMVFFVISGFVLRISLGHGPQSKPAAAGKFLLGRIFRIYPIVFVGVALLVILSAATPSGSVLVENLLLIDPSLNKRGGPCRSSCSWRPSCCCRTGWSVGTVLTPLSASPW